MTNKTPAHDAQAAANLATIEAVLDSMLDHIIRRPLPIADPVRRVLFEDVSGLGEGLFEIGGTDLMRATCRKVAEIAPHQTGRRLAICNRIWNGIGAGRDVWWA